MKVILEVISGADTGRRVLGLAGSVCTVGGSQEADEAMTDPYMSDAHFALYCRDDACVLRDLESHNGTFVNGNPVREVRLGDGDEVVAGQTVFRVRIEAAAVVEDHDNDWEGTTVAPALADGPDPMDEHLGELRATPMDCARWYLRGHAGTLYAVVDAARDPDLPELIQRSGETYRCLDDALEEADLEVRAPYLVEIPPDSVFLEALIDEGWGRRWGIYLTSSQPFDAVFAHLQGQLVTDEQGQELSTRFYDPEALGGALPRYTPEEVREFFGPVSSVMTEGREPDTLFRYAPVSFGVEVTPVKLELPEAARANPAAHV